MTLNRPYKRIARPFNMPNGSYVGGTIDESYLADHNFAPDRTTAIRGYHAIENDLRRVFEFVEPHQQNLDTFSTRLYEIFLRASTEFESNCKSILAANGYSRAGDWNMGDYKKIEAATRLSEYQIRLTIWADTPRVLQPLAPWSTGGSLPWYQDYNTVKHNRSDKFKLANLKNTVDAVAALFVILFAQFNILAFSAHELVSSHGDWNGWLAYHNSIFWIKLPTGWTTSECYGFASLTPTFGAFSF
ncbi:hypothetical protein [Acaryochloris sp. IP29b_bin.148]|uniref:hypothetical protein n=1 Tax=Acaryochloris sp. IP29b_bin.148 TaxID=2969218 RepID=UPI0026047669|nr:hypothetical protein [Acaryochloris sp. IP29b_bin.148]